MEEEEEEVEEVVGVGGEVEEREVVELEEEGCCGGGRGWCWMSKVVEVVGGRRKGRGKRKIQWTVFATERGRQGRENESEM